MCDLQYSSNALFFLLYKIFMFPFFNATNHVFLVFFCYVSYGGQSSCICMWNRIKNMKVRFMPLSFNTNTNLYNILCWYGVPTIESSLFSSKVNISMLSFAFNPCSIILHMYNSCFFRYAEEQEIQTSLCSARGVMVLTIVTVSILHTRWGVHWYSWVYISARKYAYIYWFMMQNVSPGPYVCPKHTQCHSCGSKVPGNGLSVRY